MDYVKAIVLTVYNTRPVTRRIDSTERCDTFVRCYLQADSAASVDQLPTTGAMIDGLDDMLIVDAGSRIDVLDSSDTYIMGQDLNWHKRGGTT